MSKNENRVTNVRCDPGGSRFAVLERFGKTQIWDAGSLTRITRFKTIIEKVSRRLAISRNGKFLAVGAYRNKGVSLYCGDTGRELWNRPDLAQVQKVRFSPSDDYVVVTFNEHQASFLSVRNGKSQRISLFQKYFRGIRDIYLSPFDDLYVHGQWDDDLVVTTHKQTPISSIARKTFGILDHAFSVDQLCITESTGPVSCYDIRTGMELWEFDPGEKEHGLSLAFIDHLGAYVTITWPYNDGGEHTLHLLDRTTGSPQKRFVVPDGNPAFIHEGRQMVFPDGSIVETGSGETTQKIDFLSETED